MLTALKINENGSWNWAKLTKHKLQQLIFLYWLEKEKKNTKILILFLILAHSESDQIVLKSIKCKKKNKKNSILVIFKKGIKKRIYSVKNISKD